MPILAKKQKHPQKRKKQQCTENQKSAKYQLSAKGAQILHLACQGAVRSLPTSVTPLVLILSSG